MNSKISIHSSMDYFFGVIKNDELKLTFAYAIKMLSKVVVGAVAGGGKCQ